MRKGLALRSRSQRGEGGFTLLEVLLVIVVLAVLAGLVFGLMGVIDGARVRNTEARVHQIGIEVAFHLKTKGYCPAKLEDVAPQVNQPAWMDGGKFVDPWDHPIQYKILGNGDFRVWSLGADGVSGSADDVSYKNR